MSFYGHPRHNSTITYHLTRSPKMCFCLIKIEICHMFNTIYSKKGECDVSAKQHWNVVQQIVSLLILIWTYIVQDFMYGSTLNLVTMVKNFFKSVWVIWKKSYYLTKWLIWVSQTRVLKVQCTQKVKCKVSKDFFNMFCHTISRALCL